MDRARQGGASALTRRLDAMRTQFIAGRLDQALAAAESAIRTDPREPAYLSMAARITCALGQHDRAIALATRALALRDHPEPRMVRGDALRSLGRTDEAIVDLSRAIALAPDILDLRLTLAATLEEAGRTNDARETLGTLAQSAPRDTATNPRAAYEVAKLEVHDAAYDRAVERIDRVLPAAEPGAIASTMLLHLRAKALDRAARYDEAWASAARAHADRQQQFDPAQLVARTDAAIVRWTRAALNEAHDDGIADALPVFIAGMPRSGTSLVDQMLHAHPRAAGVGELETIERWAESFDTPGAKADQGQRVGRRYLDTLRRLAPNADRVANKALGNARGLGHIASLFPLARLVHVVRDPRDVAVSCVMGTFSAERYPWTSRPEWVAVAWEQSMRMMRHWESVLDRSVLHVHYEDLVVQGEPAIRALIEHCGLPWDPAVLAFHAERRTVRTLSYDQVSRPLHAGSVGRWNHYERHLSGIQWPTVSRVRVVTA